MNWKLSFANKVRDNFPSSLFMEISYFILIIHCLNRPHKMPFLLFKLQIITGNIIHWKLKSMFLISRQPINIEWGCYLLLQFHKWKLQKDSVFLTYFLRYYLNKLTSGEIQEVEKQIMMRTTFFSPFFFPFLSTNIDESLVCEKHC